jgi:hypothetical protein
VKRHRCEFLPAFGPRCRRYAKGKAKYCGDHATVLTVRAVDAKKGTIMLESAPRTENPGKDLVFETPKDSRFVLGEWVDVPIPKWWKR